MPLYVLLLAGVLLSPAETDFKPLLNGDLATTFDLIKIEAADASLTDGEIRIAGKSRGYLATKTEYKNFVLKFEWMLEVPDDVKPAEVEANSGVLVRIKPPHVVWPECIEYQIGADDPGSLFGLKAQFEAKTSANFQRQAYKQPGEWNEAEIEANEEKIIAKLNGINVNVGKMAKPVKGPIGLQSQNGAVRFRRLQIKSLDAEK